jgi:hypothetical protein
MSEIDAQALARRVRTMQIICFALIAGVVVFQGVACYVVFVERGGAPTGPADALPTISMVAFAMFVPAVIISYVLPPVMTNLTIAQIAAGVWQLPEGADPKDYEGDEPKLLAARQTAMVISLALLEGVAFLACVAFFIEARLYALALVDVLVVLMLMRFPTEGSVRNWLTQAVERVHSLRS